MGGSSCSKGAAALPCARRRSRAVTAGAEANPVAVRHRGPAPPAGLRNIFENSPAAQFNHRMLAYATLAAVLGLWRYGTQLPALAPASR